MCPVRRQKMARTRRTIQRGMMLTETQILVKCLDGDLPQHDGIPRCPVQRHTHIISLDLKVHCAISRRCNCHVLCNLKGTKRIQRKWTTPHEFDRAHPSHALDNCAQRLETWHLDLDSRIGQLRLLDLLGIGQWARSELVKLGTIIR